MIFSNEGFMPHGHCYLWTPSLVWTMMTTDLLIGLSYLSISLCLVWLVRKVKLPFSWVFVAFGVFIMACGATHFMAVYNLWNADYWGAAFVNVVTAIASVMTAVLLFPLLPKAIELVKSAKLAEERRRQLEDTNRELEAYSQAMSAMNQELESFSASVSHDLRAPLRGIHGFSQILMNDHAAHLDPEAQKYLQFIREGSERMTKIIENLLKLSRMAQVELHRESVDVTAVAKTAIHDLLLLESPAPSPKIQIQEGLEEGSDANLLRIALDNLFSNALKFTSKVEKPLIEFGALPLAMPGSATVYFMRDNGVGFDPKYQDRLFQAFQRLHPATEYRGTGIGLTTVKRIVERHGGRIWAESQPGRGTTFFFTLRS